MGFSSFGTRVMAPSGLGTAANLGTSADRINGVLRTSHNSD